MAEIILNGQSVKTEAADMEDLKRQTYASEGLSEDIQRHCVWIVEGFQTDENLSLKDGMTINWIQKGKMPDREEMESMLCARHTPHVYEKAKEGKGGNRRSWWPGVEYCNHAGKNRYRSSASDRF
ncbi:MAG: ThiS-like ubiquitin domain-containing protein [Coprococcus sp.]